MWEKTCIDSVLEQQLGDSVVVIVHMWLNIGDSFQKLIVVILYLLGISGGSDLSLFFFAQFKSNQYVVMNSPSSKWIYRESKVKNCQTVNLMALMFANGVKMWHIFIFILLTVISIYCKVIFKVYLINVSHYVANVVQPSDWDMLLLHIGLAEDLVFSICWWWSL